MIDRADSEDGVVARTDTGYVLRFVRELPDPPEVVWAALTTSARLAEWLAPGTIEPVVGGRVHLAFDDGEYIVAGQVLAVDPPRSIAFTWGEEGEIVWTLSANASGTRLALSHMVPLTGRAEMFLAGWHTCLERLPHALAGHPQPWPAARWQEHYRWYVDRLAAGGATAAPR